MASPQHMRIENMAKRFLRKISSCALAIATLLVLLPSVACAQETEGQHDVVTEDATVEVSADNAQAYIDGATFAIDDFTRAQKGSARERDGQDVGYSYYQGTSADFCVAVVLENEVICYIPSSAHALLDIEDATSTEQLRSYFIALDAGSLTGGVVIPSEAAWHFTSGTTFELDGYAYSFAVDISDKYYITVRPLGAEGPTDALSMDLPRFVEFARPVAPDAVDIKPKAQGLAAFGEFISGIDLSPLWVTLKTTGTAIVFIFVLGLAAAYLTMRVSKVTRDVFDTIFTIPMVLPPTVCGFILLCLLGRNTALGQWFIDIGFPLIFSWPATVIAATVVAFPLMYRSCRGAFESLDANMLDAARTLGWSNGRIFFKLMIPLSWSSIAAATVLAFARALGEFGATLFLAGNYVGITRTIPIAIYFEWMSGNVDAAWFWTAIILIFSFFVILLINLWSRHTTRYRKREASAKPDKPPRPGGHRPSTQATLDATAFEESVEDSVIGGRA